MLGLPPAEPGMRVGLLGGSFDPPHAGHVHITRWALKAFRLDRVWWLVSPGNPLKTDAPADLARRVAAARAILRHPRAVVTDLEARLGTRYTAETVARLRRRYPGVRFVWLMGADNLAGFHRWERWTDILEMVPTGESPARSCSPGRARTPTGTISRMSVQRSQRWKPARLSAPISQTKRTPG